MPTLEETLELAARKRPDILYGVQMKEFTHDIFDYYVDIGLSMAYVKSEFFPMLKAKNLPMHMYCADTEEDVKLCIEKGAWLITANAPVPLMKVLGRLK